MLTILKISLAKLLHKPYNSALSVVLFAIGVALISLIIKTETFLNSHYKNNLAGIDLVVGAKGSPLQLILSSVLHLDAPTGNIPLDEVKIVQRNPLVKQTIPIALGDNYAGFRIVGTSSDYLQLYGCKFEAGNLFTKPLDAVIGAVVATRTGLIIGDTFTGVHGFMDGGHSHDDYHYTVTGILKRSGNVTDNLILTPVESVWMVHSIKHDDHCEHDEEEHEHGDDTEHQHHHHDIKCNHQLHHDAHLHAEETLDNLQHKLSIGEELTEEEAQLYNERKGELVVKKSDASDAITALLVFYKTPQAAIILPRAINQNTSMQAASPAVEINRLISLLGFGLDALRLLAWIIIFISSLNIFIYLLNLFNQSIYEIALLRLGGASRLKVVALLYFQGGIMAISGWVIGICLSYLVWRGIPYLEISESYGPYVFQKELILLAYCTAIGVLAAFVPAVRAYQSKLHYTLSR